MGTNASGQIPLVADWTDSYRGYKEKVWTTAQALALLAAIDAEFRDIAPMVKFYEEERELEFGIGAGRPRTVLTFMASLDPPYFVSLGDPNAGGVETFCYGHQPTEYPAWNLIPKDAGLLALEHFVATRTRPENVRWEEL